MLTVVHIVVQLRSDNQVQPQLPAAGARVKVQQRQLSEAQCLERHLHGTVPVAAQIRGALSAPSDGAPDAL